MTEDINTNQDDLLEGVFEEKEEAKVSEEAKAPAPQRKSHVRQEGKRPRRGRKTRERVKPEFDHKIVSIRRVTRVVAGGRRFSFSVSIVAGNKQGKVGVGLGKAGDTALAIDKALRDAKSNMMTVSLDSEMRIPHETKAKFASSEVKILPAPGRGIVAGSSVRTVLEMAGVRDVSAKILSRSKNKLNNARAAVKALSKLK